MAGSVPPPQRRLAAEVAGFSSMMEQNEEDTFVRIQHLRREVIVPSIHRYHGRLVKATGDGFLMEFGSPVEAVRCALTIQTAVTRARPEVRLWLSPSANIWCVPWSR